MSGLTTLNLGKLLRQKQNLKLIHPSQAGPEAMKEHRYGLRISLNLFASLETSLARPCQCLLALPTTEGDRATYTYM